MAHFSLRSALLCSVGSTVGSSSDFIIRLLLLGEFQGNMHHAIKYLQVCAFPVHWSHKAAVILQIGTQHFHRDSQSFLWLPWWLISFFPSYKQQCRGQRGWTDPKRRFPPLLAGVTSLLRLTHLALVQRGGGAWGPEWPTAVGAAGFQLSHLGTPLASLPQPEGGGQARRQHWLPVL